MRSRYPVLAWCEYPVLMPFTAITVVPLKDDVYAPPCMYIHVFRMYSLIYFYYVCADSEAYAWWSLPPIAVLSQQIYYLARTKHTLHTYLDKSVHCGTLTAGVGVRIEDIDKLVKYP